MFGVCILLVTWANNETFAEIEISDSDISTREICPAFEKLGPGDDGLSMSYNFFFADT